LARLPSRSLEEKSPIWFPERLAIYRATRLPVFSKNQSLSLAIEYFVGFRKKTPNLWRWPVDIEAAPSA
jgi:hypothetical protein